MNLVIFGKPQSGKTTLFHLLTGLGEKQRHMAVVEAPDPRLVKVAEAEGSSKITFVHIGFVDPPAREMLNEMRAGQGLIHVVRSDQPLKEIEAAEEDFLEKDLKTLEGALEKAKKQYSKQKSKELEKKISVLEKALGVLREGKPLRQTFSQGQEEFSGLGLLSLKPIIHVINTKFEDQEKFLPLEKEEKGRAVVVMDLLTEKELLESGDEERQQLMEEFGIAERKAERFVDIIYGVLDLLVFFTANQREAKAWTLKKDSTALEAAGKIHTDMAKGFVRAEVASWEEFVQAGGWSGLHRAGKVRLEGKDYRVRDGDVLNIRFNK